MDSFYKYFKLVEDHLRPGFKYINNEMNVDEIEEKPDNMFVNKNEKKGTLASIAPIVDNNIILSNDNGYYNRENLKKNSNDNNSNTFAYNPSNIPIDDEEIVKKINDKTIFDSIDLLFKLYSYENKENNLRILKHSYEEKIENLEKKMDYFKAYLENFYRRQIQKTRISHLNDIENSNEKMPIIMITSEHNEKLKTLRELHKEKLKQLEQVIIVIIINEINYIQSF